METTMIILVILLLVLVYQTKHQEIDCRLEKIEARLRAVGKQTKKKTKRKSNAIR